MEDSATPGDLTQTYARLQTLLLTTTSVEQFLHDLAELAVSVVDPPASCGITTEYDGHPITVVSSDLRATDLDETQYGLDQGSCLEAMRTGAVIYVADLAVESRWPDYVAHARTAGLRCSLSLPLMVRDAHFGAMNLYDFHVADAFDADAQRRGQVFAAQASGALQLATQNARSRQLLLQLEQALTSRSVIDQAIGIVMARRRCDAEEAFMHLRKLSQNSQRKLREIAATMVAAADDTGDHPRTDTPTTS